MSNLPQQASLQETLNYATMQKNLHSYQGTSFGSEPFSLVLPSGKTINNWTVQRDFQDLFEPYGEESY